MPGESYQDLFARVASFYGDDAAHAQRIYGLHQQALVHCRRPQVLSNGGTKRGLPISCFLNEASDSLDGIVRPLERECLARLQGRRDRQLLGQPALHRREGGDERQDVRRHPVHPGDGQPDAGDQPGLAAPGLGRGPTCRSAIRRSRSSSRSACPTGGDPNRKAPNLHHGIQVSDAFMRAVEADEPWALISPKDKSIVRKISARSLWIRILTARIEMGEPYYRVLRPREQRPAGASQASPGWRFAPRICAARSPCRPGSTITASSGPRVCCLSSLEPRDLVRLEGPSAVHRGRDALPRQRAAGFHRPRPERDGAGEIRRQPRAVGRAGRDGLPQLPAGDEGAVRERHRQGV